MLKIFVSLFCLISSGALAETQKLKADVASSKQFAKELGFCYFYFLEVSQCLVDKDFTRTLSQSAKEQAAKLSISYSKGTSKLSQYLSKIAQTIPDIDLSGDAIRSVKMLTAAIEGNCINIGIPMEKHDVICKRLVSEPLSRLKELSECPNDGKVGC